MTARKPATKPRTRKGPVVLATEHELATLPPDLAKGALAASAIVMARELDTVTNSATSKSMCQARLQDVMDRLRALAPVKREADRVDDLKTRRNARRAAGGAAASN